MTEYSLFWGDTHHNTYQFPEGRAQVPPLDEVLVETSQHLDFYCAAYYAACMDHVPVLDDVARAHPGFQGKGVEHWKSDERLDREWSEVQEICARTNRAGAFAVFPGYEWQGRGTSGDHNVYFRHEGGTIARVQTVGELYEAIRDCDAIAVPHHIGYRTGTRAPTWNACDERLTPFAEIYSVHGCSETDEEWIGLRHNASMGPGGSGSTYADALRHGLHLGCICSTDNWRNVPGEYNRGLMACYASGLDRESLWEAFLARRVYGVTGDRIRLDFRVNGALMGERIACRGARRIEVEVRGCDAVDRIELLRGDEVIATHCHQGTWGVPRGTSRYKLRVELGWGPPEGTLPMPDRTWDGTLELGTGRFLGAEGYRVTPMPTPPSIDGARAAFHIPVRQSDVRLGLQSSCVYEFEADADAPLVVSADDVAERGKVGEFASGSRIASFRQDSIVRFKAATGCDPEQYERADVIYQTGCRMKIHRAIPEAGYTAKWSYEDDTPVEGETYYRVRVEQRNGQRAWSSPVWVEGA